MTRPESDDLETLFAAARAAPPRMPDPLCAAIEADAVSALPRSGGWRRLLAGIGGIPGLGGMVAATMAGVWIGVVGPDSVATPVESFLGVETADAGTLFGSGWDEFEGEDG